MAHTFGSINFGNIPVAAPSGISVAGARQGVSYNAGYIELGSDDPFNTAWWVTDQRYIRVSGALWALDTASAGGFGWRIQSNLMTILNDGEEWSFLQDSGNSYFRIESLAAERGIQWYNTGAPTGERAFVGWSQSGGGNLILRNSAAIANAGIQIQSNGGGGIIFSISGTQVGQFQYNSSVFGNIINVSAGGSIGASAIIGSAGIMYDTSSQSLQVKSIIGTEFLRFSFLSNDATFSTPVKLGSSANSAFTLTGVTAGAAVLDTANYVSVTIGGVAYKLALIV